jgi:hypothetical protein
VRCHTQVIRSTPNLGAARASMAAMGSQVAYTGYRGRIGPFDLMAAPAIEPDGLWGSIVLAAVSRRGFVPPFVRTASRPSTFSKTFKETCSKCVGAFCLASPVLIMEKQYQRRHATGHLFWTLIFRLACS